MPSPTPPRMAASWSRDSRSSSWVRTRWMNCASCPVMGSSTFGSSGSSSRRARAMAARTPTTSSEEISGNPNAEFSPPAADTSRPRRNLGSLNPSVIHRGSPESHTVPGSPSPRENRRCRVCSTNEESAPSEVLHTSTRCSSSPRTSQSSATSQPSSVPITSRAGWTWSNRSDSATIRVIACWSSGTCAVHAARSTSRCVETKSFPDSVSTAWAIESTTVVVPSFRRSSIRPRHAPSRRNRWRSFSIQGTEATSTSGARCMRSSSRVYPSSSSAAGFAWTYRRSSSVTKTASGMASNTTASGIGAIFILWPA